MCFPWALARLLPSAVRVRIKSLHVSEAAKYRQHQAPGAGASVGPRFRRAPHRVNRQLGHLGDFLGGAVLGVVEECLASSGLAVVPCPAPHLPPRLVNYACRGGNLTSREAPGPSGSSVPTRATST
jgi:hypothetical protein